MSNYFQVLPTELKDELLDYFVGEDLLDICRNMPLIYQQKCSDNKFWNNRLHTDFEWESEKVITDLLREYSAKNLYTIMSYLYENDEHFEEPINDLDFMDFLNILSDSFSDDPTGIERDLVDMLMKTNDRDILLKNLNDSHLAAYLYNTYPKYKTAILMSILLLSNYETQTEFISKVSNLPTYSYQELVEIFTNVGIGSNAEDNIKENFKADRFVEKQKSAEKPEHDIELNSKDDKEESDVESDEHESGSGDEE